jgi:hypothetical protein|tara:strand:- start:1080 stop:1742 length:663 start_codon:yes stop_codon:yes gene_type:complete
MATPMKHVGKVGEKPCVVLYREVPGEPDFALIVQTTNLPDAQHDALMNIVQSAEAQEANEVSEVLDRRQFSDGSNMLQQLHFDKRIEKVSVDLVSLTPTPSNSISLAEVNAEIRKIANNSNPPLKTDAIQQMDNLDNQSVTTNPVVAESDPTLAQTNAPVVEGDVNESQIALNLLQQATILEDDAHAIMNDAEAKRQEAYRLNPDLEPRKGPGRPKKIIS